MNRLDIDDDDDEEEELVERYSGHSSFFNLIVSRKDVSFSDPSSFGLIRKKQNRVKVTVRQPRKVNKLSSDGA